MQANGLADCGNRFCFNCVEIPALKIKSNPGAVNLSATLNTSVTIKASPGAVTFALVRNGVATGSVPVSITTSWVVPTLFGNVTEYAYFTSPASALTDGGGDNIPSGSVAGRF